MNKNTLGQEKWDAIRHFFNEVVNAHLDNNSDRHNEALDDIKVKLSVDELDWVQSISTESFIDTFGENMFDEDLQTRMKDEDDIAERYNWPPPFRGFYPKS